MEIVVAGGTGVIGTEVVRIAQIRGHHARALSRANGVDVLTGAGLDEAVRGADVVIDTLSVVTQSARASTRFFTRTTAHLLAAERRHGVGHHLALSIVGVDRAPHAYYAGKLAQEHVVQAGGTPWSVQRTTQFHDFAAQMYGRAAVGPVHPAVRMRTQPVSCTEVAQRLLDIVEDGPSGRVRDLAGPREEDLAEMMRRWARHRGRAGWMPKLALPGRFGTAMRVGSLLPQGDADLGSVTFDDWLRAQTHG